GWLPSRPVRDHLRRRRRRNGRSLQSPRQPSRPRRRHQGVDGKVQRTIRGGPAVTLADSNNSPVTPIGAWNQDGVIVFGSREGLRRVSASGGESTLITKVDADRKEAGHGFPQFLPCGNRVLHL